MTERVVALLCNLALSDISQKKKKVVIFYDRSERVPVPVSVPVSMPVRRASGRALASRVRLSESESGFWLVHDEACCGV
jgi:hypothetical protein